jgi:hypothetical protein
VKTEPLMPILPQTVLAPLCQPFAKQADWILELYAMTHEAPKHPGKCLRCFYALMEAASGEKAHSLMPLKQWIERNTVIGVRAGDEICTVLPVELEESTLSDFCSSTIAKVRDKHLVTQDGTVVLEVMFRQNEAAA